MGGINYLFPPDQITNLATWRFIFHFPGSSSSDDVKAASTALKEADFKVAQFPAGLDLGFDAQTSSVDIAVEVPEDIRRQPNALADYESDVWKILGNMASCGYEEVFYEAVDWSDETDSPQAHALTQGKRWWQFWK
ncbi:hypothetical protein [uncultured Rubinisphaera sp.]|uniref:hypothetical protein n=1 Tax=uncultured Rubinisphaera sp. TaxID=1678686 RepID=UPI0030DA9EE2|tara:strand:+ start:952 stop:1359 length:408 start_codon:yes stop_codon:yes gene_type:complete